ncbi:MAG: coniferyl aldehyde dehydrogenase [Aestuariivirga sp.]|nr:coniferyl aldehyde dehydrogenase [Aestuariivirga sp.]
MEVPKEFTDCLARQRAAYLKDPIPGAGSRRADLEALHRMITENETEIVAAIDADFGVRSAVETRLLELFPVREGIRSAISHLAKWMRPQKRSVDWLVFPGASNRVIPQPLGVIGVIVPWNFPIQLSFGPLIDILAAGNRAMVKMSENSPRLSRLLAEISARYLPPDKLTFFECGGRGPAFSSLPFDHLVFTGSSATGRAVMASAAANLCPVTLELGGKAPAVVAPDFPITTAAERIIWAKCINAGQVCVNVDYLFLPEDKTEEFVANARRLVAERYPDLNSPDYTSIINQRAYDRLTAMLRDAEEKGATVVNLAHGQKPDAARRKLPPHILLGVNEDMTVMQEEIFGPLLPIKTYRDPEEVIDYVNSHDRPLSFYPFTNEKRLADMYITRIISGSVGVNEAIVQVGQHDLPFGGVGASGMGHYHGYEGFLTFSKLRPVFHQGPISSIQLALQPPYGTRARRTLDWMFRLRG